MHQQLYIFAVGEAVSFDGRKSCEIPSYVFEKEAMDHTSFLYFLVPCQLETLLINQFPAKDFKLTDVADGK